VLSNTQPLHQFGPGMMLSGRPSKRGIRVVQNTQPISCNIVPSTTTPNSLTLTTFRKDVKRKRSS